jgi:outer membrane receptor protein involved in Fe transport
VLKLKKKIILLVMMLVLPVVFGFFQLAQAATTSKITGKVVNEETGEPLPGVAVSIAGTKMGALTNEDGEYYILNVPVGTYTLKASLIGFAPVEVENVTTSVDLATYQDFTLSKKALELGTVIKVRAERPLVVKDKTTSIAITSGEKLQAMPVRGYDQVVGIQNSVVRMNSNVDVRQRGARESLPMAPEINLRGGRPSEVAYYVDGFSQQDPLSGISTANIANNAIQEVSVTSGAFSAEYGHVASGIVNVITKSGTDKYSLKAEAVSDNVFAPFGYDSYDQNWYSADFSGPIPGLNKSYFFFSGERRWMGDRTPSIKTKDIYETYGIDTLYNMDEPQRMPYNTLGGWSYQAKLDFQLQENIKLALSGNGSEDKWQEYRHYYLNPTFTNQIQHVPRYDDKNLGLNAKLTHQLNPNTYYNLSASYFETERFRGDGVIYEDLAAYEREVANPEWDYYNIFREGDSIFASDINPLIEVGSAEDTFVTFYESYWTNYLKRKSSYVGFKGDITSQITHSNTLKFGFDFQRHTVRYFEQLNATQGYMNERVNRYGYDSSSEESDSQNFMNDTKHPINLGVYLQDRFEWSAFVVNAGVRFDYFDYKALRLRDIYRPFDPDNTGSSTIERSDLENSKKFTRVSPRLGISFPVSDKTQLYFNFGKFYQRPDLVRLYTGYDFLEARVTAGSYYPFPSPNLEPEMTTQYEFGMTHQLGDKIAMEVVAYYKDVSDLTQIYHLNGVDPRAYDFFANTDYGTIKGFDFNLTMRRTRNISLDLKYSLSYASGTGSYAQSAYNIAWKNPTGFPKTTNPLDYDQRHSIIAMIDYRTEKGQGPIIGGSHIFENMGLNTIIQLGSGLPYTPTKIYDAVSIGKSVNQEPTGSINSANMPWTITIDMKLEKVFHVKNYQITPYIWVKNLLNAENVSGVYEGTGKADVTGYLGTEEALVRASDTEHPDFLYRYELAQSNPKNYANPRMIYGGIRMAF